MMGRYWDVPESHPCALGQWVDAAHTVVQVGDLKISISPGSDRKHLGFRVEGRVPSGPLAHLEPGGSIHPVAEDRAEVEGELAAMSEGALVPTGQPASIASGDIQIGDDIYVVAVRYALTGVLKNDIYQGAWGLFGRAPSAETPRMTAGQIVYAQYLAGGALTPQVIWCAPRKGSQGRWENAICFPRDSAGPMWIETRQPMLAGSTLLVPVNERPYVSSPDVEPTAVDLPTMTLTYRLEGRDAKGATLGVLLDWGEGAQAVRKVDKPWDVNGKAILTVAGGVITVKQGHDGQHVQAEFSPR
jgi:hypothetical protein